MGLCLPCSRARSGALEVSRRRDAVERGGDPCVGRRPLGLVSRHALLWATLTMLPVINLRRLGRCVEGAPCRSSLSAPHLWGGAPMILLRAPWKGFACFEIDYLWPKVQVYPTRTLGLRVRGPSGRIRVRILESTALRVAPRPRRLSVILVQFDGRCSTLLDAGMRAGTCFLPPPRAFKAVRDCKA